MIQGKEISVLEREINGCHVTISFAKEPVEGIVDKVKSILSNAYDERVQQDLLELASLK